MKPLNVIGVYRTLRFSAVALSVLGTAIGVEAAVAAEMRSNACPVDGCVVKIVDAKRSGKELELTFESNFSPDVSKNHFHTWWGEKYTVKHVGRNAKAVYGVTKGRWQLTADYPAFVTKRAASTSVRDGAVTMCVSAANRDHNILNIDTFHCVNVADKL